MKLKDMTIPQHNNQAFEMRPVSIELVLELLNHAVWAPNHKLREPWRFIYIPYSGKPDWFDNKVPTHLVITLKNDNSKNRQNEDLAAVFCLIQNFKLLAWERRLGVNVTFHEWMYDPEYCCRLGIPDKEKVAAVLELAFYSDTQETSLAIPSTLNMSWLQ